MGALNENELQYIIDKIQTVITNTKQYNEQYGKIYTKCYWSEVKMSNRREVFKDTEIKAVNQLEKFLENLIVCSEQIITMAEVVREDLHKLQHIGDLEICNVYSDIIIEKLDMIALGNKCFSEMQEEYVRCSILVKKIIDRSSTPSRWEKIKEYFFKKIQFIRKW